MRGVVLVHAITENSKNIAFKYLRASEIEASRKKYASETANVLHLIGKSMIAKISTDYGYDYEKLYKNDHGKPLHDDFSFNITHSNKLVVGCFVNHRNLKLGIDVLEKDRFYPEIVMRKFSDYEQKMVDKNRKYFGILWTGKEAILKALGTGISGGIHRVSLNFDTQEKVVIDNEILDWQIESIELKDHVCRLVSEKKITLNFQKF